MRWRIYTIARVERRGDEHDQGRRNGQRQLQVAVVYAQGSKREVDYYTPAPLGATTERWWGVINSDYAGLLFLYFCYAMNYVFSGVHQEALRAVLELGMVRSTHSIDKDTDLQRIATAAKNITCSLTRGENTPAPGQRSLW